MRILYQPNLHTNFNHSFCKNLQNDKADIQNNESSNFMTFPMPDIYPQISFTAMKKSEFYGTDRLAIEQFKAPVEKFKRKTDFDNWANNKYKDLLKKDYKGRNKEIQIQRKNIIDEWNTYLTDENKEYSVAEKLIILNGITKNLKPDEATIPPVLNKGVLADTIYNLKKDLSTENIKAFDFNKKYTNNLRAYYMEDTTASNGETKWIIIPSKEHDKANFKQNVEKLKALSHKSWCTKSNNAEPYLSKGDFHIYLENGQPKLGVRFNGDKIAEIQGEKNDGQIPLKYFDIFNDYRKNKQLNDFEPKAKDEIQKANIKKRQATALRNKLKNEIENKDYVSIYDVFGITSVKNNNNTLTLAEYHQPKAGNLTLSDIGLSEGELFKKVENIEGDANLENSELKSLYNVKQIGGNLLLAYSQLEDFGKLETIGGGLTFSEVWDRPERAAKVTGLKNIQEIGGELDIAISNITDLGSLKSVKGDVFIKKSGLTSLKNLEYIGGNLYMEDSSVETLGKLKEIGKNAQLQHSALKDLGDLEKVGGSIDLKGTHATSLKNLKYVENVLSLTNSEIKDLGKLEKVMGYISLNEYLFDKNTDISKYLDGSDF